MRSQEDSFEGLTNGRRIDWNMRDVDWGFIVKQQHYGTLFYTLFPCVALGLVLWSFDVEPELDVDVADVLDNPDYARPKKSGTIPAVAAVIVPFLLFLTTLLIGELSIFKTHHRNITEAVYVIVYFVLNWFCAFAVHIFTQQISAIAVAEPRPDFADRCRVNDSGHCTGETEDGLRSFFSGHASSAALSAVYSSIYLLWLVYFRRVSHDYAAPSCHIRKTWSERFLHEFTHGTILYLVVIQLGFAYVVGISRIIDNRHHIWDVTCGLFVGVVVASFFAIHAIAALPMMPKKEYY